MDKAPEITYRKIDPSSKAEEANPVLDRMHELFARSIEENQAFGSYLADELYSGNPKMRKRLLDESRRQLAIYRKKYGVFELFQFMTGKSSSPTTHIPEFENSPLALQSLLNEGLDANPHNTEGFQRALQNSIPMESEGIITQFPDPQDVPDEDFIEMTKAHVEKFRAKQKELQTRLPKLRSDFKTNLNSKLPEVPTDNLGFLDSFQILLTDDLLILPSERYGDCDVDKKRIRISESASSQELAGIFTHEALHAIAGRTILETTSTYSGNETEAQTSQQTQKVGLRIAHRFRWLNEAVTENLTRLLIDPKAPIYRNERTLLQLLTHSGKTEVPLQLFYDAYFENYDPSLPPGHRIPKWRSLTKAINEAYEPRFLVNLDDVVEKDGIQAGIGFIKAQKEIQGATRPISPLE